MNLRQSDFSGGFFGRLLATDLMLRFGYLVKLCLLLLLLVVVVVVAVILLLFYYCY